MNWQGTERLGMDYVLNTDATGIKALSQAVMGGYNARVMVRVCGLASSRLP